jgi:predicted nucleic acid-binding protein
MVERLVVDASALIDLLLGRPAATDLTRRIERSGAELHAPAHLDAEVLSALGRIHRAGHVPAERVELSLEALEGSPIVRHELPDLLRPAWTRRERLRLADALYVCLAEHLDTVVLTTDRRLAAAERRAELP